MGILNMKFFRFLGFKKKPNAPWDKYYHHKDMDLNIPDMSLYEYFKMNSLEHSNLTAINYYGKKINYRDLLGYVDKCAKSFYYQGIRRGDVVTICMPNTPEGVISFLALNKIGAISNMVHPLSSENEIRDTLKETGSVMMVLIDMDYVKVKNIIKDTDVFKVIIVRPNNFMPMLMNLGYQITQGYKTELPKKSKLYIYWSDFMGNTDNDEKEYLFKGKKNTPAVMLHSGGSTGTPKAIVLSNGNFVTLVEQSRIVFDELEKGDKCLAIMPIFHGFGLGVCVYTPLCLGAEIILLPKFNAMEFDKLLNKNRPEFVIGVPTLFEALLKNPRADKLKLNYLKYVISGGDTLKGTMEKEINEFLQTHGARTKVLQGYGMSECLAAVALSLKSVDKPGSVGIPFPGCYIGIFAPDDTELKVGEIGEICITGPNVMLGYYRNVKETNAVLHLHDDGNIWLHSGDLGWMDENGFITYTSRLKRLIISSGYNVYPTQIEALLETHPAVMQATVVGIPHKYKVEVPKAFIVLNKGYKGNDTLIEELRELCKKNLAKYALVYEYEFRKSLPRTIVGKVDFRSLQIENNKRRQQKNEAKKEV